MDERKNAVESSSLRLPACLVHAVELLKFLFTHTSDRLTRTQPHSLIPLSYDCLTMYPRHVCSCLSQRMRSTQKGTDWNYIRYKKSELGEFLECFSCTKQRTQRKRFFLTGNISMNHWTQRFGWSSDEGNTFAMTTSIGRSHLVNTKLSDFPRFGMSARRFSRLFLFIGHENLHKFFYLGHEASGGNR